MMLHIPKLLDLEVVARCRQVLLDADWTDGRITAGHQSTRVKHNRQIPEGSPASRQLGDVVLAALERCPLFVSAALPQRVFPPLFNRYDQDMAFGPHVDNALRASPGSPVRMRTDLSATLFLSDPDSYDGGELVVEDTHGSQPVKLPAGDLILYPASSVHHVTPITRGCRLASFFWIQSLVRDAARRRLLFDLDMNIIQLNRMLPESSVAVSLTGIYHNLLRGWAEP
jgi:PKHD-type hydroxylase